MQIGLQANATSLSTGRYSLHRDDHRLPQRHADHLHLQRHGHGRKRRPGRDLLGAGGRLDGLGLKKIVSATGGVILDEGDGSVLWFSGSFGGGGGTYTSPAGDFSTLVLNSERHLHAAP